MAEPYALPNETWSTIAAGHTWTRGTDTTVELTDGALFDVGGGRIRFGVAPQFGVVTSFALMNYTSRTGNVLSGLTACTMGAVVSPGDETKVWPAGTVVERVVTGEDVASRIMGPASATSGHFFKADGTTGKLAKAEAIAAGELPAIPLTGLATQATDTIVANVTAGSAAPTAVAIAEQRVVGRITGGHVTDLTAAQVNTILGGGGTTFLTVQVFS